MGRRPVSGVRGWAAAAASSSRLGRPEEPRGPGSPDRRGRRRRCTLAVSRSWEEAEGIMSGRNLHLSTTERVIKGARRAGPSLSTPRGRGPRPGDASGTEGGNRGGEAGGRRGRQAEPIPEKDLEGVWEPGGRDPHGGSPAGAPGVFCCTWTRS